MPDRKPQQATPDRPFLFLPPTPHFPLPTPHSLQQPLSDRTTDDRGG
ncbi:MAG: hypothetical protein KME27_12015 [Lyngbya sp. HA4199-MV5]|nr:hypothetical protein [Lyngbya sp. HA4199-MV5]